MNRLSSNLRKGEHELLSRLDIRPEISGPYIDRTIVKEFLHYSAHDCLQNLINDVLNIPIGSGSPISNLSHRSQAIAFTFRASM